MTTDEPDQEVPSEEIAAAPSSELVVRQHRAAPPTARHRPRAVARVGGRLLELRRRPRAVMSISAAATVGGAVLATGLRRALRHAAVSTGSRGTSIAVAGYIVQEVHVVHHVVHHVGRPPAS
jgi:hypothetical protein